MVKKLNWQLLVRRPATALTGHIIIEGFSKTPSALGIPCTINQMSEYSPGKGDIYLDKDSLIKMTQIIIKNIENNSTFLRDVLKNGYEQCETIKNVVSLNNFKELSNEQLKDLFERYVEKFLLFCPYLNVPFPIEEYLTRRINECLVKLFPESTDERRQKYFIILSTPQKESEVYLEQKDLLKIAILCKSGKDTRELLDKHAREFGHMILTNNLLSEPADVKYYLTAINQISNPEEALAALERTKEKLMAEYKEFTKSLPEDLINDAELLQDYMFFRAYRIEAMRSAQQNIKPLLKEIANRFDLAFEDIVWFIWPEIVDLLETGKVPNFEPRKKYFMAKNINGKVTYSDKPFAEKRVKDVSVISGKVACRGHVKGKVRIIKNKKEMIDFLDGEILVTSMTTPDYVIIMRKAAAIVTDEGGVLCHAAIISREFDVPCIIGTKIATKVLRNGDLVEVDANRGMVKKIK